MDPIEEQIQAQIQAIQNTPGFSSYQPSFGNVGIAPLQSLDISNNFIAEPTPNVTDMIKQAGTNIIKQKASEIAAKKLGIGTLPAGINFGNPIVNNIAPVALFSGLSAIKNKIANRNLMAAINRESTIDLQNKMDRGDFGSTTPTPQDSQRGGQYDGGATSQSAGFDQAERGGPQGR